MVKQQPSVDPCKSKLKMRCNERRQEQQQTATRSCAQPPLESFRLRGNQLCGSILIGNYNYLTQLEVSENEMEVLDLSSLAQLETLKCSRNRLMELMINGSNLISLIADRNCLHRIAATPTPEKLTHVDISHNHFVALPQWLSGCSALDSLHAHHNQLQTIEDFLQTFSIKALHDLDLSYNRLQALHRLPERLGGAIETLLLHSNELQRLPDHFFAITAASLKLLNVSCNKLATLPPAPPPTAAAPATGAEDGRAGLALEQVLMSSNGLDDRVFDVLAAAPKLRVLHAAYNKINTLPAPCLKAWRCLEELVLSGNSLQRLPDGLCELPKLQVLRVHSNMLLNTPPLGQLGSLKVLDLAHNHLDRLDLIAIMPRGLKYLDLSCNVQLQVDEQQVKLCRSQRNWSLVDVSGENRVCLPSSATPASSRDTKLPRPPWSVGFAETTGHCRKLLVSQLRAGDFRANEAVFGMFEAASGCRMAASKMVQLVPKLLQQEQEQRDGRPSGDQLKYALLAAQRRMTAEHVAAAILCHIGRENPRSGRDYVRPERLKRYVLRVSSSGCMGAYLVRRTSNVQLTREPPLRDGGTELPAGGLPDPTFTEWTLTNDDEYLVVGNADLWLALDVDRVAREIRKEQNVVLAAKRVQDIAQSFGAAGNLSVIVVRFRNIATDVDHLIRELKRTVRRKAPLAAATSAATSAAVAAEATTAAACRHRLGASRPLLAPRSERSSPSGQSDQAMAVAPSGGKALPDARGEFVLAHARVLEENNEPETVDESDSVLSEEQFKCWEYMLEQNTQLLFDKELNTISKSFTRNRPAASDRLDAKPNLLLGGHNNKFLSASSPQLLYAEVKKSAALHQHHQPLHPSPHSQLGPQQVSLLSRRFGSNRSFQASLAATGYGWLADSPSHDLLPDIGSASSFGKLGGGPNAAYFGSLQRLLPYNLEYDFAVPRERFVFGANDDGDEDEGEGEGEGEGDDCCEEASRMRKYWGVATTEL